MPGSWESLWGGGCVINRDPYARLPGWGVVGPKALVTLNSLTIYTVGREGSSSGVKRLPAGRPAHRSHTAMLECPRRLHVP